MSHCLEGQLSNLYIIFLHWYQNCLWVYVRTSSFTYRIVNCMLCISFIARDETLWVTEASMDTISGFHCYSFLLPQGYLLTANMINLNMALWLYHRTLTFTFWYWRDENHVTYIGIIGAYLLQFGYGFVDGMLIRVLINGALVTW